MFAEICLAIIAVTLVVLVVVIVKISTQAQASIHQVQIDITYLSTEVSRLAGSLNEFVKSDLHKLSEEATALTGKLAGLTSDIHDKSRSLNFLFKPFSFLSSQASSDSSSSDDVSAQCEPIPQIIKWIATSVSLIKTTREFVKRL